ncbi:MAG: hypothetical protein WBQ94_20970 [Terracidiphilus sp.]
MANRPFGTSVWGRAGVSLALAGLQWCALPTVYAQSNSGYGQVWSHEAESRANQAREEKERQLSDRFPDKPSIPPAFIIPAEPLGFSPPGSIYLGERWSFVSLDFLDEDRLLFTFRVPGLIRRGNGDRGDVRQIRALVLALPQGTVEAEAVWQVHDRARYLWMLKDGHFLLRDRDGLQLGDASLQMKPFLHFPGPVLWLELDPKQQYLVTNSREPALAAHKAGDVASAPNSSSDKDQSPGTGTNHPGDKDPSPGTPTTAATNGFEEAQAPAGRSDMVLRILRRDSGKVMLVSRVATAVHLPLNSDGYLEGLRGNGERWMLNLDYFSGGSRLLGHVDSSCMPAYDFVSEREILITACESSGAHRLEAMDTEGRHLWDVLSPGQGIWPLVVSSQDGLRLVRETLAVKHSVDSLSPIETEDVKGQLVRVFDAATGKVTLAAPAIPALDGGGNMAISPSGRRVAVLNAGAIQVFELPPPAPMPEMDGSQKGH